MTVWFNDTFTDSNGTALSAHTSDSGHTWSLALSGITNSPAISTGFGGAVYPTAIGYNAWRASATPSSADQIVSGSYYYDTVNFNSAGICARLASDGTRGYSALYVKSSGTWEICRIVSGVLTSVASTAQALTTGNSYAVELEVTGTGATVAVRLRVGGVLTVSYDDTNANRATAAGFAGIFFNASNVGTGMYFGSISGADVGAGAATAVTMSGPTGGNVGVASTNFTVGANGTITGTVVVTPSDAGAGGTFTPTTVSISSGTPTGTFTYTPASTGAKTISVTNSGSLTNPSNITYTATAVGAPTAGVASFSSSTDTTINVSATAASGGTAPLTYQWHRSTTANFTPGGGTVLSGATSLTLADSASLAADTPYYYICRVTDNTALTADTKQVAGSLKATTLKIGFIGDSITVGYGLSAGLDPVTQIAPLLAKMYKNRAVTTVNRGVNGSKTGDWLSGSGNLTAAKTALAAAAVTHIHVMFGANDAATSNNVSAATYKSNLQNIIADLTGAGYKLILSYPMYYPDGANSGAGSAASVALLQAYQAQIDSLINHTTVLRGDVLAFNYFINNTSELQADQVHTTAAGAVALATMWARAIDRNVFGLDRPPSTKTVTVTFESRAGALRTNLSGLKWEWSDVFGTVIDSGTGATTNASGVFSITVRTYLASAGIGYLKVTNSAGAINTTDLAFFGPVAVA